MKKAILVVILCLFILPNTILAQADSIINQCKIFAEKHEYQSCIDLLSSEIDNYPNNADMHYWLGRYSHYIVYDSRPFANYSTQWSDTMVLRNLYKAIELDPKHGDARYFIGVESSARAHEALTDFNMPTTEKVETFKNKFIKCGDMNVFPPHILEYGRNMLKSCDTNAILFVDGDLSVNVLTYLQVFEQYRQDVSAICTSLLERPYYPKFLIEGLPSIQTPVEMTLKMRDIYQLHSYKWPQEGRTISFPISFNDSIYIIDWHIKPNVGKSKLWSGTAIILSIIEANALNRPIYFENSSRSISGLERNLTLSGFISQLTPIDKAYKILLSNEDKINRTLLNPNNYEHYYDISENQQPRIAELVGNSSRNKIMYYACLLNRLGYTEKSLRIVEQCQSMMPDSVFATDDYYKEMEQLINKEQKIK